MTTITCNKHMMVGDSAVDDAGCRSTATKVFKVKDDIVGFAGSLSEGLKFVEWYRDKRGTKPGLIDSEAIVLHKDGTMDYWDEAMFPYPIEDSFVALGSGKAAAQGAMHTGVTPLEALEIACKVDVSTEKPITVYYTNGND